MMLALSNLIYLKKLKNWRYSMGNIIVIVVCAIVIGLSVFLTYRNKKNGGGCCGCSSDSCSEPENKK